MPRFQNTNRSSISGVKVCVVALPQGSKSRPASSLRGIQATRQNGKNSRYPGCWIVWAGTRPQVAKQLGACRDLRRQERHDAHRQWGARFAVGNERGTHQGRTAVPLVPVKSGRTGVCGFKWKEVVQLSEHLESYR